MIIDGFKIMLIGMTTVFLFLSLLTIILSQFANILKPPQSEPIPKNPSNSQIPVNVITAAIASYEDDEQRRL